MNNNFHSDIRHIDHAMCVVGAIPPDLLFTFLLTSVSSKIPFMQSNITKTLIGWMRAVWRVIGWVKAVWRVIGWMQAVWHLKAYVWWLCRSIYCQLNFSHACIAIYEPQTSKHIEMPYKYSCTNGQSTFYQLNTSQIINAFSYKV